MNRGYFMRWLYVFFLLLLSTPAEAAWREAKTRHFVIYSSGDEKALRDFAIKVERFDTVLRGRFAVSDNETSQRLTIFLLSSAEEVERAYGGGKNSRNVAGFYNGSVTDSLAVVNRVKSNEEGVLDGDTILFHEYTHHFMLHYFPAAYPAWYVEGFAEFLATTEFTPEGNAKIGLPAYHRSYGLLLGKTFSSEQLFTKNVADVALDDQDAFYGRSWLMVHYLDRASGREKQLLNYLREINNGKASIDAARLIFGDLKQLDKELASYLKGKIGYATLRKPTPLPNDITITTLDAANAALIPLRLRSMRGVDLEEAKALVPKFKVIAEKFPTSGEAWYWLAQGYAYANRDGDAQVALDTALKINPTFARALLLRGEIAVRKLITDKNDDAAAWKAARALIAKANRADTNDPLPLYRYYQSWRQQGITPNQPSKDGLRRVFELAPEDGDVRMNFAALLAEQEEYARAINVIKPLAFDPHANSESNVARTMLNKFIEAKSANEKTVATQPVAAK
jgi:tetratricopeptide (TPR) repeat protein